jgi:hypothetical protein
MQPKDQNFSDLNNSKQVMKIRCQKRDVYGISRRCRGIIRSVCIELRRLNYVQSPSVCSLHSLPSQFLFIFSKLIDIRIFMIFASTALRSVYAVPCDEVMPFTSACRVVRMSTSLSPALRLH